MRGTTHRTASQELCLTGHPIQKPLRAHRRHRKIKRQTVHEAKTTHPCSRRNVHPRPKNVGSDPAQTPSTNRVLSFDGNGSYVSIPSSPLIQNANEITLEAWIYPLLPTTNPNRGWFVAKSDGQTLSSARTYELDWLVNGQMIQANLFLGSTT